ncbi:hypothetical protein BO70DRAFT_286507 [Aspergillus heteromorphus CBS 117.55]|uniref:C3H1-type domain-containing protein n=1 Tax=Aspergillus heteromorphus CBS 117.55 TaxID=1448321 RepID=A0A317WUI8_9EURO|nr:uncharacterized protein BO70DRAFT_286507 [Aspergillus heteromorphus CBS 117.55]PWY88518.1 hypothetical protein BO70DRAFT_286507 [Aspergillus heteromorphus CBS 117.55]
MSSPTRPQFFCTRPNGTLTPLVAVDELPSHISIRGAPRVLSASGTQGMTSLGTVNPRTRCYVVEGATPVATRASSAAANAAGHRTHDYDLQLAFMRLLSDESLPTSQRLAVTSFLQQGAPQNYYSSPSSSTWLVPNSGGGAAGHSGPKQGPHYNAKKEYCSYWIRHGECDYQQQGCLYKHEMPNDPAMLEKLGLRDIPRWYRDKYGIPSLIPNGHAHPRSHISHALPPADSGAFRAIQYPARLGINGAMDASEIEKESKYKASGQLLTQQSSIALAGASRLAYDSTKGPVPPKHGARYVSSEDNSAMKKLDLLSFEPLPEFAEQSTMEPAPGSMSALNYPRPREIVPFPSSNNHRDEFARSLQSLMPASMAGPSDYLMTSPSFKNQASQGRAKKTPKSRRLYGYQPRSQLSALDSGHETGAVDAFGNFLMNYATTSSSVASPTSRVTSGSHLASPNIGPALDMPVSEPPSRQESPSSPSGTASCESSPSIARNRTRAKQPKSVFGAIGSRRIHRQQSDGSSEDDLLGLAMRDAR